MRLATLLVAFAALAACKPYLNAESPAPPGRTARLEPVDGFWGIKRYHAEISQGVALAVSCSHGGPCRHMKIRSEDPSIAEVRLASLGVLQPAAIYSSATAAALVVVGRAPGKTRIHVATDDGGRVIDVTVISPPPPAHAATQAISATTD